MFLRSIAALTIACAAGAPAAADVLVVGSGNYPTVQDAVNAAHERDIVLVYSTVATNVVIEKGVTIVADVPGTISWFGSLHIQNVPAGSTVVVSGFALGIASPLLVSSCGGSIRIHDCHVAPTSVPFQLALTAAVCTSSRDVAFLHSSITGGAGVNGPDGAAAISATGCSLTIDDSIVRGGAGRAGAPNDFSHQSDPGGAGGHAIVLARGGLVLQCADVAGGAGGDGFFGNCSSFPASAGGPGGDGLVLGANAVARAIDGATAGGSGGVGGVNSCNRAPDGAPGSAVNAAGGTWSRVAGPNRALAAPRIVRAGRPLELRFSGAPFEQVFLVMSHTAAHVDAPELDGVWLLQGPARTIACGALDAGGALTLDWTTPSLPAGVAGDVLHLQPVMIDALGNTRLGCARVLVRLDANH
jgi:hypothetical protein